MRGVGLAGPPTGDRSDREWDPEEAPPGGLDSGRRIYGEVVRFDELVGLGEVAAETVSSGPGSRYPFHCTQISDGSRFIAVGTRVGFSLAAGRRGKWEATRVAPWPADRVG